MEKHHHQNKLPRNEQKKPLFSPVFLPPRKTGKIFEDTFLAANKTKNKNKEKWAKQRKPENRKTLFFPWFFDGSKGKS